MSFQIQNTGTACFQREPLTVRLRNLIHDYPEGVGIVKELIQNADDADFKAAISTCIGTANTERKEKLDSLLTLNFQSFEKVHILPV
jgi:hypothetical protein